MTLLRKMLEVNMAYEVYANEVCAREVHAHEMHA
jgi:hypothetical protein